MQTSITVHDTNQTKENAMNTNLYHGESRKEKRMNAIAKTVLGAVLVALGLTLTTWAAESPPPATSDVATGAVVEAPAAQGQPDKAPEKPTLRDLLLGAVQIDLPSPVTTRLLRVAVLSPRGAPMIDEIQVFGTDGKNLARGATVAASDHATAPAGKPSQYHISYVNDGRYGPGSAWAGSGKGPGGWIQLTLLTVSPIRRLVISSVGQLVQVEVLTSADGTAWKRIASGHPAGLADDEADVNRAFFSEARRRIERYVPEQADAQAPLSSTPRATHWPRCPLMADLAEARALLRRVKEAGAEVGALGKALEAVAQRITACDPSTALPSDVAAMFLDLRRCKRDLLFSHPQLATLASVLFVKRHPYLPTHNYSDFLDGNLKGGGGIFALDLPREGGRLDPAKATLRSIFNAGTGLARDPTLDWEARTVWFAYMPQPATVTGKAPGADDGQKRWHIWKVPVAGGPASEVTTGSFHDYYPCVLPDGDIAFVTTRCDRRFLCWVPTSMTLYRMRPDGTHIRALSFNNISEWFPTVRRDGRIMWTRSEYMDKGADYGHTLWSIRPDGTHPELVYGNNTPNNFMNAMEVPGRENELCATIISHFGDFNGPLAYIDLARSPYDQAAVTPITHDSFHPNQGNAGISRDPWPISRDLVLASHNADGQFALYILDRWGNRELLYRDPAIGCMTPLPLAARTRPPVLPEQIGAGPATMAVMDVYDGLSPTVERGRVAWLRICRELPSRLERRNDGSTVERYDGFMEHYASPVDRVGSPFGWPAYCAKEVIGIVPVEDDGSAHFTVPTGQMFYFQALDKDFIEIQRMASIIQAQPGERRTCLGCHDDRRRTGMPSRLAKALTRQPSTPQPPPWGAGPFWYQRVVQPVLDRKCVSCHDGKKGLKKLDLTATLDGTLAPASYRTLITGGFVHHLNCRWGMLHSKPPPLGVGSPKSKLLPILAQKEHTEVKLTSEERQALLCWIDLNCPLWGDYQHRGDRAAGKPYCTADCPPNPEPAKKNQ